MSKKIKSRPVKEGEVLRICRDEDCPNCGYPETATVCNILNGAPNPIGINCSKCGWYKKIPQRKKIKDGGK
jgi:hypothetical protein